MSKVYLSPVAKFPEVQVPKSLDFTDIEISRVIDIYRVTEKIAKEILREKYYGSKTPLGFENWKDYWTTYANNIEVKNNGNVKN